MRESRYVTILSLCLLAFAPQCSAYAQGIDGEAITDPSGVLAGPFGKPRAVLDEFGALRIPIAVYSDDAVEEFVPDITDPNSIRLGEFKTCGTYTVLLYLYDKEKEGTRRYWLSVDSRAGIVTRLEGFGFADASSSFAIAAAPQRLGKAVETITAILTKEISHPTPLQQQNWDSVAGLPCHTTQNVQAALASPNVHTTGDNTAPKRIGNGVTAPILIYSVEPEYPPIEAKKKMSGSVLVNLWVDTNGLPSHVRVIRSMGVDFDEAATHTVQQYRFKPAIKDGAPVLVELNVIVNFKAF